MPETFFHITLNSPEKNPLFTTRLLRLHNCYHFHKRQIEANLEFVSENSSVVGNCFTGMYCVNQDERLKTAIGENSLPFRASI